MPRHWIALAALVSACNSLDAPGPKGSSVTLVPTDVRAVEAPLRAPPPISGGTLAVTGDGRLAVAADPDRDRVSLVALDTFQVRHVALEPGDEPGRVLAADGGTAYVALRRAGALAVIDLATARIVQRLPACAAPRGLALQAGAGLLHVACAEGRLLSLRIEAGQLQPEPVRDLALGEDARDVLVQGETLWVSTFKRAGLLHLAADGTLLERKAPSPVVDEVITFDDRGRPAPTGPMQPHLAYRSVLGADGSVLMLHQAASNAEVKLKLDPSTSGAAAYGGSFGCGGIVSRAVTRVNARGQVETQAVASGVLSVDAAMSSSADQLAVVNAGPQDDDAPRPTVVFDTDSDFAVATPTTAPAFSTGTIKLVPDSAELRNAQRSQLSVFRLPWSGPVNACQRPSQFPVLGQATAVVTRRRAPGEQDDWIVQSREPALLSIVSQPLVTAAPQTSVIVLGGDSVQDTGHALFHRDSGAGIACASCHPEGAEDGHVWHFDTVGKRRTQALHVGLEGTAPFHWNGEEQDIGHLMEDVFVGRMGGVHQSPERLGALQRWLFSLQPPAAAVASDPQAAERGEKLFASADVGCKRCHSGDKLTDNRSVDVGTGGKLQVPSLRAIAYRAPFMHDGCAARLRDRFDPACGGQKHGDVSGLSERDLDDLVAYMLTL